MEEIKEELKAEKIPEPPAEKSLSKIGKADPVKTTEVKYYSFNRCVEYIETVYGKDIRDWNDKYRNKVFDPSVAYQDFWNFLLRVAVSGNNCLFEMPYHLIDDLVYKMEENKWVVEILKIFKQEFPDTKMFYVAW